MRAATALQWRRNALAIAVTATLVARSPVYRIFAYTIDHCADHIHGVETAPLRQP